jgi:septal ring factor EnvC (AmiA/AmiB activator)
MCGGRPSAPEIVYQGPSQEEIAAEKQAMELLRQQQEQSNIRLQSQLDAQIASTNAAITKQREELAAQQAAAAAEGAARQATTYSTATTAQTGAPETAMTTQPIQAKKKAASGLKIAPGGTVAGAGAGLNIGI